MQQALWFRTQEEDYCTLSQFRRLTRATKGDKSLIRLASEKTPRRYFTRKHVERLLARRARTRARRERREARS